MLGTCITAAHRDLGPHEHDQIVCVSWTPVSDRVADDRRLAPRREIERNLHYARENLIASVLAAMEFGDDPSLITHEDLDAAWASMHRAAATLRAAEDQ